MGEDRLETISRDERLQVGFSYLFGWIPALVFWIQSKGKSEYVRFHTMQVILFSVVWFVMNVLTTVLMIVVSVLSFIFYYSLVEILPTLDSFAAGIDIILALLVIFGSVFIPFISYGPTFILGLLNIAATIQGFSGKDWRYPLLAKWAEKINQRDMETSLRNES
jgi:uncharacterized membrane protein